MKFFNRVGHVDIRKDYRWSLDETKNVTSNVEIMHLNGLDFRFHVEKTIGAVKDKASVSILGLNRDSISRFSTFITFFSTILTMVVAIPAGVFAATHRNSPLDYTISASSILFDSIPTFWLGLMLLYIFSFKMDIFPLDGYKLIEHYGWGEALKSLVLPCFALGMGHVAGLARQTRSQMLNVLSADYIRTARAKGLSERMVNYKHALKNTMSLVVTIVGGSIGAMLGGSTVIENVFNIQGVGKLAYTSLMRSDYYQEQGIIMFITLIYAGMNILLDIVYKKLDPRIEL